MLNAGSPVAFKAALRHDTIRRAMGVESEAALDDLTERRYRASSIDSRDQEPRRDDSSPDCRSAI